MQFQNPSVKWKELYPKKMLIFFPKKFPLRPLKPSYPIMNADLACLFHSPSLTPRTNSDTCPKKLNFLNKRA